MNKILRKNRFFLWPFLASWLILALVLIFNKKWEIHLFVNRFHAPFFDSFFRAITHLGDGLFATIVVIIFLFISLRKGLILGASAIASGLVAQFLKRLIFYDIPRPKAFFRDSVDLYFVPGVDMHELYSFPSGHTTIAFCVFLIIASFSKSDFIKTGFFILALLVGFSRIYLSQHFLIDMYFGAILGSVTALLFIKLLEKPQKKWLDKSIVTVFGSNE